MSYYLPTGYFAQYGAGNYGEGNYGEGETTTTTTTSGGLSDTGMPILLGATIGIALIICAVVLFTKARKRKK